MRGESELDQDAPRVFCFCLKARPWPRDWHKILCKYPFCASLRPVESLLFASCVVCFGAWDVIKLCCLQREGERVWSLWERNPTCLLYEKGSLADEHLRWCLSAGKPVQMWRVGAHRTSCPLPGGGEVLISVMTLGHSLTFSPQVLFHRHFIPRWIPKGGLLACGHLETHISMFSAAPLTTAQPWK